uniref:Uncharacterized protein n=1 Tax=Laticauda laticaudata TaxID=8630 RepID=A0A8C5SEZ0_LATLA
LFLNLTLLLVYDVPQCNRSCDYCKNPVAVKKQVEALQHSTKSWSRTYIGPSVSSWNACDPELYGGGKRGSPPKLSIQTNTLPYQATPITDSSGFLACAVEMEYEAFRTNKMANLYKASVLKKFKPKRMGIGFQRMSGMFQSASEVLSSKEGDGINVIKEEIGSNWKEDSSCGPKPLDMDDILDKDEATNKICKKGGESPETKGQHDTAEAVTALAVSPEKRKPTKKQLLLAEAARKESQNISKFFSIPKAGCKVKASENDLVEENINCLNELPQFPSRTACEVKAEPPETATVFKEELTTSSPPKEAEFLVEEDTTNDCEYLNGKRPGSAEDLESPAEKRLRMMNKSSILSQSEGKADRLAKKKVTFDPNLSQDDKEGTTRAIQPPSKTLSLKETANIVVKYLTPFYKSGKFASKVGYKLFISLSLLCLIYVSRLVKTALSSIHNFSVFPHYFHQLLTKYIQGE